MEIEKNFKYLWNFRDENKKKRNKNGFEYKVWFSPSIFLIDEDCKTFSIFGRMEKWILRNVLWDKCLL